MATKSLAALLGMPNRQKFSGAKLCVICRWLAVLALILPSLAIAADDAVIAFVDVNVVHPQLNRVDSGQTVIVSGAKITGIGNAATTTIPSNARRVDGADRYLVAGLAEMHAHVPKSAKGREYLEDILFLWVANGVTTVRNMNGEPAHIELREQILRQDVLGPRLYTAGPPFQGAKIKTAAEARVLVTEQNDAGYDFLKVHMALPLPIYEAVAAAANAEQFPFAGHVAEGIGLTRALEAHQASIDHLDSYLPALVHADTNIAELDYGLLGMPYTPYVDAARFAEVAQATKAAGVWNASTLTLAENFVGPYDADAVLAGMQYMPARMVRGWGGIARGFQKSLDDPQMAQQFLAYRKQLVRALHTAGAGLLLGSDAPQVLNVPGFSTHNELDLMVEAGLTPAQALITGTVNPAIFMGAEQSFGRIKQGLDADLVLVEANPLEQLSTLRTPLGVMLRGRWISAEELSDGLERIAAKHRE